LCGLLLTISCVLVACGLKGDPTLKSYEKPEAPSGLRAVHRESEIILLWDFPKEKESAIKGFHVMKSFGGIFEKLAFLENSGRSYTFTDYMTGTAYRYKIVSESLKGVTNDSNMIEVAPKNPPPPPVRLTFEVEYDTLTLTWRNGGEGVYYNVYKSEKKGVYALVPVNTQPLTQTSFKDYFDIKRTVFYTVRSLAGSGIRDEGPASEEIEIAPSEFIPSAPEALRAVVTEENVQLIWKEPGETWVAGYRVYREINNGKGFLFIGETPAPAFLDNDRPATKRNYRVTAIGPSKEGPPAEIRDVVFMEPR
jgi:hypothetical protein